MKTTRDVEGERHGGAENETAAPGKVSLTGSLGGGRPIQREPAVAVGADAPPIQRAAAGAGDADRAAATERWLDESVRPDLAPTGGGRQLDPAVQRGMESSFAADFSAVRVHEGNHVPALGALAYTQGADLHFAPGHYDPSSDRGRDLIGHELTHVVQQAEGRVAAPTQAKGAPINADPALESEADDLGSRAARGEQVRTGTTVTAGPAAGIQRYAFINGAQVTAVTPAHTPQQAAFLRDAVVRDYNDAAEFAAHAAGTTDYLGNLADGTWMRFSPNGINLLGEDHTLVRLDHVMPAVGSTNFIYERFSNDAMAPGSGMETAYQTENNAIMAQMGIAGQPNHQAHGAESLYPKIGYGMVLALPHLNAGGIAHLQPPIYTGQPVQRYFKIGWGYSVDNAAQVAAAQAAAQPVQPEAANLAVVHAAVAPLLGPFLTALPVDGWLGDGIAAQPAGGQAALLAALRQFAQAMIQAMAERALGDPSARLNPAQQAQFGPGGGANNNDRRQMFARWRDFNFEDSVQAATANGVRYAGMGNNHLLHLRAQGLQANQHAFDMINANLNAFRVHTAALQGVAVPVP